MRGNHRIWGRNDFIEPEPLDSVSLALIASCNVKPRWADRTRLGAPHEVWRDGVLLGYVATRVGGQMYKTSTMDFWLPLPGGWSEKDPDHGRAIINLIHACEENKQ